MDIDALLVIIFMFGIAIFCFAALIWVFYDANRFNKNQEKVQEEIRKADRRLYKSMMQEQLRKQELHDHNPRYIPRKVKRFVWDRDGGRCVECGGVQDLEYDHLIPHSKGGANTENNIQLLCLKCNRGKTDKIM